MLCDVCFRMLRQQDERVWKGTHDLNFKHHSDEGSLRRSAELRCGICRVLAEELKLKISNATAELESNKANTTAGPSPSKPQHGQLLRTPNQERFKATLHIETHPDIRSRSSSPGGPRFNISAMLSVLDHPRVKDLYRLDFKLRYNQIRGKRTFILQKINSFDPPFRTQLSHSTSSDEVYTLVVNWMKRCSKMCPLTSPCKRVTDRTPSWYPARLISLEELKKANTIENKIQNRASDQANMKVRLVETENWTPTKDNLYVTLSHCWGQVVTSQHKLTSHNIDDMKAGIQLNTLPKTFQQAITFAARLPRVGYIWIDSLCIKQGDETDWLEQSASMYRVYSETYLNISATDSSDSQGGLFRRRDPALLLEDEVTLNIQGLPGAHPPKIVPPENVVQTSTSLGPSTGRKLIRLLATYWLFKHFFQLLHFLHHELGAFLEVDQPSLSDPLLSQKAAKPQTPQKTKLNGALKRARVKFDAVNAFRPTRRSNTNLGEDSDPDLTEHSDLKRCTILDASFWSNRVDTAPVNRRAWVLQERLMSPRVLHFCRDQVAWECCGFDAAEGQPEGMPNFQLTPGGIIEESRLKGLEVREDGKRLRNIRLHGNIDPDRHMRPKIYALELWRRIVEVYAKTSITNDDDKLIALSGMAKLMAAKVGSKRNPARYAAGLWVDYLECQLLWQVEPVWREVSERFENLSDTPAKYRAPSWSWAAVNADKGYGITCADLTDRDLYIKIDKVVVKPKDKQNIYGIVQSEGTFLDMWGKLRRAILYEKKREAKGRFGWRLIDRGVDKEEHTNVYLDCPAQALKDGAFGYEQRESRIYVIPAAKGPRIASEESKYLTCLLVQQLDSDDEDLPVFKRIGITKLSPWADSKALSQILIDLQSDVSMPHRGHDTKKHMHKIRLV